MKSEEFSVTKKEKDGSNGFPMPKGATPKEENILNKRKFALWIHQDVLKEIDNIYTSDNCRSRSDFIEKAVKFYIGYLHEEKSVEYISPFIASVVESSVYGLEQRISKHLFRMAVELAKISNISAAANGVDRLTLEELHKMCVDEVKGINGVLSFEKAVRFQQE